MIHSQKIPTNCNVLMYGFGQTTEKNILYIVFNINLKILILIFIKFDKKVKLTLSLKSLSVLF